MGEIEVGDYIVEWDDKKAEINKKKHKVNFETAAKVFLDDNRIDDFDEFHSDDEDRVKTIGMVGKILAVVYTERQEKYRLISARLADRDEKEKYYEWLTFPLQFDDKLQYQIGHLTKKFQAAYMSNISSSKSSSDVL